MKHLAFLLALTLTGCTHPTVRCLLLDNRSCPEHSNGGGSSLSAPVPPTPPNPCTSGATITNNQCNLNPLGLATACDPTDADGDPYDDDCTPAPPASAPDPTHP